MNRSITVVTAPTTEPVTLEEVKDQAEVQHNEDDALVLKALKAARSYVETYTRRKLLTQTLRMRIDWGFPCVIDLPFAPAQTVPDSAANFTYIATDGTETQVDTDVYVADTDSEPARVYIAYNQTWPTVRCQRRAVSIDWVAGYGAAATSIPDDIIQACLLMATHYYEVRQPHVLTIGGVMVDYPKTVDDLLQPYVIHF